MKSVSKRLIVLAIAAVSFSAAAQTYVGGISIARGSHGGTQTSMSLGVAGPGYTASYTQSNVPRYGYGQHRHHHHNQGAYWTPNGYQNYAPVPTVREYVYQAPTVIYQPTVYVERYSGYRSSRTGTYLVRPGEPYSCDIGHYEKVCDSTGQSCAVCY